MLCILYKFSCDRFCKSLLMIYSLYGDDYHHQHIHSPAVGREQVQNMSQTVLNDTVERNDKYEW